MFYCETCYLTNPFGQYACRVFSQFSKSFVYFCGKMLIVFANTNRIIHSVFIVLRFFVGQRPKTGIPGLFGAKNRYILKSSQKRTLRALLLVQSALYLVLAG